MSDVIMKSLRHDGQQFHQYQLKKQQPPTSKSLTTIKTSTNTVGNPGTPIQLHLHHTFYEIFLIIEVISIVTLWIILLNVATFQQHDECHLLNRTLFTILIWKIVCLLFFPLLTFLLRYFGFGFTNVVFRLSLCLLGLKLSLYLVPILYF